MSWTIGKTILSGMAFVMNTATPLEGFWGELRDPYEPHRKTLYFLGHTKSLAIGRMKTCISFS